MSNLIKPVDIEDAMRLDMTAIAVIEDIDGLTIAAPPVPTDLGADLPYVVVERLGGTRDSIVVDTHQVGIDIWANDWAEAQAAANTIVGLVSALPWLTPSEAEYLDADIIAHPYNNPDPDHPDIPRVSITAQVSTRAAD